MVASTAAARARMSASLVRNGATAAATAALASTWAWARRACTASNIAATLAPPPLLLEWALPLGRPERPDAAGEARPVRAVRTQTAMTSRSRSARSAYVPARSSG
jgi:hypothetical protein